MGTQKVHCRGGAQHARPCGSRSAPGSMTSIDPYMQKRMLASAETKEKPLAERIGKGLSLVRVVIQNFSKTIVVQFVFEVIG